MAATPFMRADAPDRPRVVAVLSNVALFPILVVTVVVSVVASVVAAVVVGVATASVWAWRSLSPGGTPEPPGSTGQVVELVEGAATRLAPGPDAARPL